MRGIAGSSDGPVCCLQVLNIAVYRLLGEKGVYYGSKLGKKVLLPILQLFS